MRRIVLVRNIVAIFTNIARVVPITRLAAWQTAVAGIVIVNRRSGSGAKNFAYSISIVVLATTVRHKAVE